MSSCDTCPDTNDQYTCGCINPTTFGCTTYTKDVNLPAIDVATDDEDLDGDTIVKKINDAIAVLQAAKGKILISTNDTVLAELKDKISAGSNITLTEVGTGSERRLRIDAVEGGTPVDVNVKITSADTVSGYLNSKLVIGNHLTKATQNVGANETLKLDVNPTSLISSDAGNLVALGNDGRLKVSFTSPNGSETKMASGNGIVVSGSGTNLDPYVVSANGFIQSTRSCFDEIWREIPLTSSTGTSSVTYTAGKPMYRYRYDGSIEFKGSITYNVSFGSYTSTSRRFAITAGSLPTTCVSLTEQAGVSDLKGINYIDSLQASSDQIVQQYGYIIRKSNQNIIVELQSAFTNATTKTVVVNFDGAVFHPTFA